jgi:pyridinium-3,5-biscarboxylic acid mononucleotide sulfurtransferase
VTLNTCANLGVESAEDIPEALGVLEPLLATAQASAIAVSGGVDSMTLTHVAMAVMPEKPVVFHAVSPAVPARATARVREHAARHGWDLQVVDAGELRDPRYVGNPVNRCYFCKTNLYGFIRREWPGPLFSGANLDDLSDYRPGLNAAAEYGVRHPFVEAGVDKAAVRAIARHLRLEDLSELPAQPCLSSRIETGRPIDAKHLQLVDRVESQIREWLGPVDLRCRVRRLGLCLEVDSQVLPALDPFVVQAIQRLCEREADGAGLHFVGIEGYVRGSAFVGERAGSS